MQVQLRPVRLEIIIKDTIKELEAEVSERLKAGWVLHGDWTIITQDHKSRFAQGVCEIGFVPLKIPQEVIDQQQQSRLLVPNPGPGGALIR